jgi:predicted secreted Zn-dependent protease
VFFILGGTLKRGGARNTTCEECKRLWDAYFAATNVHVRVTGKYRLAALERNLVKLAALKDQLMASEKARQTARDLMRRHETEAHLAGEPEFRDAFKSIEISH